MEQLEPLREALEVVTGDAAQIEAVSQSWKRMAVELHETATDYAAALNGGIRWKGAAAEAYARAATEVIDGIAGVADHAHHPGSCGKDMRADIDGVRCRTCGQRRHWLQ